MKDFLLSVLILISISSYSQCWNAPTFFKTYEIGEPTFNDIKGDVRILGDGIVPFSKSFSNFSFLIFESKQFGGLLINPTIKMGGKKLYTRNNVMLNKVEMAGNDTIFSAGEISIYNISGTGSNNVIRLAIGMPYVLIGSKSYKAGDVINGNIKVEQCGNTALPFKPNSFKAYLKDDYFHYSFETLPGSRIRSFDLICEYKSKEYSIKVWLPVIRRNKYEFELHKDSVLNKIKK